MLKVLSFFFLEFCLLIPNSVKRKLIQVLLSCKVEVDLSATKNGASSCYQSPSGFNGQVAVAVEPAPMLDCVKALGSSSPSKLPMACLFNWRDIIKD